MFKVCVILEDTGQNGHRQVVSESEEFSTNQKQGFINIVLRVAISVLKTLDYRTCRYCEGRGFFVREWPSGRKEKVTCVGCGGDRKILYLKSC